MFSMGHGSKFLMSLAYSPLGNQVACGNIDGMISLFSLKTKENECNFKDHGLPIRALKFD